MLQGIEDIADNYEAFIIDVWGVIHNGIEPFAGTVSCLQSLKKAGKQILLLSNTPNRNSAIAEHLFEMGIDNSLYHHIVTAGDSAYENLKDYQGQSCWYAGDRYASSLTAGLDLTLLPDHKGATFIINAVHGIDEPTRTNFLRLLDEASEKNLPMICANPDMVVNVGDELKECPGTFALYYEEAGGTVIYHGKPHRPIYDMAWSMLGKPDKSRIVAIGDSLHTDIQGANNFGIDSVFNFSGIHGEELDTPEKIENLLSGQNHSPAYCLKEFCY